MQIGFVKFCDLLNLTQENVAKINVIVIVIGIVIARYCFVWLKSNYN